MNKNVKRLLTLEDLEKFYFDSNKSFHFNSKESGYNLVVHVPTVFEICENNDDTMLFVKSRVFHIGRNRNASNVTEEAAIKAMKTMAYKPLLANFTDINGELDFTSHDMKIDPNNEDSIIYEEKQIGCITADEPWFEYDEELDKKYVCVYIAIPREYTKAADVIERKNGTKVSVELLINDFSYSCKDKCLMLNDVTVQGLTALGTNPDTGKEVMEGMEGSKIVLEDFSTENNSFNFELNQIIQDAVTTALNNYKKNSEEGGNVVEKLNNEEEVVETETPEVEVEMEADETEAVVVEETEVPEEETAETFKEETEAPSNFSKKFELSHDDVRCGLYNLLATVENADNEWYGIVSVFDDNFIYQGMFAGAIYGQKYTKDGECVAFEGERYSLHAEYLTDSEFAQLNDMRNNYAAISEELATYKKAEDKAEKLEVFNDEAFAEFLDTKEFKELMSDESLEKFSKEELEKEANLAFSMLVKKNGNFSKKTTEEVDNKKPLMFAFAGTENTNSFLDGLLNK